MSVGPPGIIIIIIIIIKPISIARFLFGSNLVGLRECWSSRDNHVTECNVLPFGLIKVSIDDYDDHDDYGGPDDHGDYDRNEYGFDLVSDPVPRFPSVLKVNDKSMGWNGLGWITGWGEV